MKMTITADKLTLTSVSLILMSKWKNRRIIHCITPNRLLHIIIIIIITLIIIKISLTEIWRIETLMLVLIRTLIITL